MEMRLDTQIRLDRRVGDIIQKGMKRNPEDLESSPTEERE